MTAQIIKLPKPKPILRCTQCGSTTEAACECGVSYEMLRPRVAAEKALEHSPGKSNRVIADEIGIGKDTVKRAREQVAQNAPPARRNGRDGKSYPAKGHSRKEKPPYIPCKPILTKDPMVNAALIVMFDHIMKYWTDRQLELFIAAIRELHEGTKCFIERKEVMSRRREEKRKER